MTEDLREMTIKESPQFITENKTSKLNILAFSLASGLLGGLAFFFLTALFLLKWNDDLGFYLFLLKQYFVGYQLSWGGALIGFFYGSLVGGLGAYLLGIIYNYSPGLLNKDISSQPDSEKPFRFHTSNFAITISMFFGVGLFAFTLFSILAGITTSRLHAILEFYLNGYEISWAGCFVGLVYGIGIGSISAALFAKIYNLVSLFLQKDKAPVTSECLHPNALAVALGCLMGSGLFLMTIALLVKGGQNVGGNLNQLGQILPGYKVTWFGAILGGFYGAVLGGLFGWCLVRSYEFVSGFAKKDSLVLLGIKFKNIIQLVVKNDVYLLILVFCIFMDLPLSVLWNVYRIPFSLILLTLFATLFIYWLFTKTKQKNWLIPAGLILLYNAAVFISLQNVIDPVRAKEQIIKNIMGALITIIVVFLLERFITLRRVIRTLLITGMIMGVITVFQQITQTFDFDYWGLSQVSFQNVFGEVEGFRSAGPLGDPNYYAQLLIVILGVSLFQIWKAKDWQSFILPGLAFVTCFLSFVYTYSRGGLFALSVVSLIFVVKVYREKIERRNLLVLAALVVFTLPFIPSQYIQRLSTFQLFFNSQPDTEILIFDYEGGNNDRPLETINDRLTQDYGFRGRLSENIIALQLFWDYPLIGAGIGNYEANYQAYSKRLGIDPRDKDREAHNLYLEVASETGLLGFVTFGLLLFVMFRVTIKAQKELRSANKTETADLIVGLTAGFIGYLAAGVFLHAAFTNIFWMLVGIFFALPLIVKNELSKDQNHSSSAGLALNE